MQKKRGRPARLGMEEGPRFELTAQVIRIYNKLRNAGEKHQDALKITAQKIRNKYFETPMSSTEVRRILAKLQPNNAPLSFGVFEPDEKEPGEIRTFPDGKRVKVGLKFGFVPRPKHPRSNAKTSKLKTSSKQTV